MQYKIATHCTLKTTSEKFSDASPVLFTESTLMPRTILPSRSVVVVVWSAVALALYLLSQDPYSYGQIGGEYLVFSENLEQVAFYPWQRTFTFLLVPCLLFGAIQVLRGNLHSAILAFTLEATLFLAVNILYVIRDSLAVRGYIGDEGSMLPIVVTLAGLLCRMLLVTVVGLSRRNVKQSS